MNSLKLKRALALIWTLVFMITLLPSASLAAGKAVRVAGQQVFVIKSGATGMTIAQRAQLIQNNLDNALVASNNRSPGAVSVVSVSGTPVITLGGYRVITVDGATARLSATTPSILAQKWAHSLKAALANSASVDAYIASLTAGGSSGNASAGSVNYRQGKVVYIPAGMVLPITLSSGISSAHATAGDRIEAKLTEDITLNDAVIPAGSIVSGQVAEVKAGKRLAKSGQMQVKFTSLRTPDGCQSPITAHLIGGVEKAHSKDGETFAGETGATKAKAAALHGAVGAGVGTLAGLAIGAIAGHGRGAGRGALAGLAIGGGLGVVESFTWRKGRDVVLPSGRQMQLQLDTPATIAVGAVSGAM